MSTPNNLKAPAEHLHRQVYALELSVRALYFVQNEVMYDSEKFDHASFNNLRLYGMPNGCLWASFMLLTHAIELGLKGLLAKDGICYKKTHDTAKLYNQLSPETQQLLNENFDAEKKCMANRRGGHKWENLTLEEVFAKIKDNSVELRYLPVPTEEPTSINLQNQDTDEYADQVQKMRQELHAPGMLVRIILRVFKNLRPSDIK